jgi:uncharacterized protein DUF6064
MPIPFTRDQFFEVFREYNETVWPAQLVLYGLALATLILVAARVQHRGRLVSFILALLWLWMGAVYHFSFFSAINPAAVIFGALFIGEAVAFLWSALGRRPLTFTPKADIFGLIGGLLIGYALLVYPALGYAIGHRYPASPTFGLPCPTTIFTLGLLVWAGASLPIRLLIIPLMWSLLGVWAAVSFGVVQDIGLIVAAIFTIGVVIVRRRGASWSATTSRQFKVLPIKRRVENT